MIHFVYGYGCIGLCYTIDNYVNAMIIVQPNSPDTRGIIVHLGHQVIVQSSLLPHLTKPAAVFVIISDNVIWMQGSLKTYFY